jgi:hypothetical protein
MSPVIEMDEWPSKSATALMCTPDSKPRDRSRMPQRMNARTLDTRRLRKLGNVDAHVFHDNYPTQSQANRGSKVWEGPQS